MRTSNRKTNRGTKENLFSLGSDEVKEFEFRNTEKFVKKIQNI